jgi:HAD superfamily hydrolase (TIGR01509 family)
MRSAAASARTCTIAAVIAQPELVIFDCDGVLVDSEPIALRINQQMLAELGWHLSADEIVEQFVGRSIQSNRTTVEAHLGGPLPEGWLDEFVARIHSAHTAELERVDGVTEALAGIDALGIATCVATSGTHAKTEHSLRLVGLYERFAGRIFSATDVAHGKPAPDLFLHAAAELRTEPAACLVVEDSRYGVDAARAAGMRCIGYAGGVTPASWLDGPGTVVIDDLRKIPQYLTSRIG